MEKYSRKIRKLLCGDDIRIKKLLVLVLSYFSEEKRTKYGKVIFPEETFTDIHASVLALIPSEVARLECQGAILTVLNMIFYGISNMIPAIDEDRAFNMALGNPLALWMYDHADEIDTLCKMAAVLQTGGDKIPQCLVRLPNATQRCREILFPKIEEINAASEKACPPEYLALFKYKNSDPVPE